MGTTIPLAPGYESVALEADQLIAMGVGGIAGFPDERILRVLDTLSGDGDIWTAGTWAQNTVTVVGLTAILTRLGYYREQAQHLLETMEAEDVGFVMAQTTVPDVTDMAEVDARAVIANAFLFNGNASFDTHATIVAGNVIATDPVADADVAYGSVVDRVVSTGTP